MVYQAHYTFLEYSHKIQVCAGPQAGEPNQSVCGHGEKARAWNRLKTPAQALGF